MVYICITCEKVKILYVYRCRIFEKYFLKKFSHIGGVFSGGQNGQIRCNVLVTGVTLYFLMYVNKKRVFFYIDY